MTKPLPAPDQLKELWLPIGPSTVLGGQAADSPNVTGRILDVDVSPDGRRVYAAAADGGVWYSNDEGGSWMALGAWFVTPHEELLDYFGNSLTAGSVVVDWDTSANGEADTVWVGTGETIPRRQGYPGSQLGGIGVLSAHDPVGTTRADVFAPVWSREGAGMEGTGVYRLAMRPGAGHAGELVAAASDGFYARTGPAGSDTWAKVSAKPFDAERVVTDVVWAPTGIYVALHSTGVWHADQPAGPFTKVDLPDLQDGRISLAASADGSVVYALGEGPRLWRIAGTSAKRVANVPAALLVSPDTATEGEDEEEAGRITGDPEHALPVEAAGNQGSYDLAIAVDPDHPDVIVLGGAAVETSHAALFKCTVQDPGGSPQLDYAPAHDAANDSPANDPTYIGRGVHPDVHVITFAKRGANVDLWVGGDGGVYRSTHGGRSLTWQQRNNGLAVVEAGYVACHPGSEAVLVIGTQDNGVLERTGDTAWTWSLDGDGGGVAFHPLPNAARYVAQATHSNWRSNDYKTTQPVRRSGARPLPDHEQKENDKANFYSSPGVVAATNPEGARLAVGTNRVWVSEDFGAHWFTVPNGSDPRGPGSGGKPRTDTKQDVPYDDDRATTLAARWNGEDELFVLNARSVQRYARAPGTGKWSRHAVTDHKKKCSREYTESDIKGSKMPHLPPLGQWSDLAIHLPGPEGKSTLYVACASVHGKPKMDTLWWFDGTGTWHATKLRDAVEAPALAVAVHPTDSNTVFVGTTVGVWQGTYSHPAGSDPVWTWSTFSAGLPEAAVQDLALFRDPPSGTPTLLLLRAALQSRGVWEVDLLAPCDEQTYLRVHRLDSRRRPVTSLADPMNAPVITFSPFASPDIAIRPAPPVSAATMPPAPPAGAFPIGPGPYPGDTYEQWRFRLWTFQTAFRQLEPACRPTGRWSDTFETLLVAYKQANTLGDAHTIDQATWTNVVTQARVQQPPWDGPVPTEADLLQLLVGEGTQDTPTTFSTRRLLIDVLIHHRGIQPLPSANASVLLLLRKMGEPKASWDGLAISAAWKTATVSALSSGHAPAGGWPDHWVTADATPIRHPAADLAATNPAAASLDAARPRPAEFELVFPAGTKAGTYLLLAVCSSTTATVTAARLVGSTLGELLTQSSHVAAHELVLT